MSSNAKRAKLTVNDKPRSSIIGAFQKQMNDKSVDGSLDSDEDVLIDEEEIRDSKLTKNSNAAAKSSRSSSGCSSSSSLDSEVNSPKLSSTAKTIEASQNTTKKPPQLAHIVLNKSMIAAASIISNHERNKMFSTINKDQDIEDIHSEPSYSPVFTQQSSKTQAYSEKNAPSSSESSESELSETESEAISHNKSVISVTGSSEPPTPIPTKRVYKPRKNKDTPSSSVASVESSPKKQKKRKTKGTPNTPSSS
jgi:hypothetical protein